MNGFCSQTSNYMTTTFKDKLWEPLYDHNVLHSIIPLQCFEDDIGGSIEGDLLRAIKATIWGGLMKDYANKVHHQGGLPVTFSEHCREDTCSSILIDSDWRGVSSLIFRPSSGSRFSSIWGLLGVLERCTISEIFRPKGELVAGRSMKEGSCGSRLWERCRCSDLQWKKCWFEESL